MGIALALYVVLVLVGAPLLSWRTAASGLITTLPRTSVYRGAIGTAWFLAALGLAVWLLDGSLSAADIGLTALPTGTLLAATLVTLLGLAAGVALFGRLRALLGVRESDAVRHLVPRTGRERRLYAGVSLTAGITEEIVFRGIVLTALTALPGLDGGAGPWLAAGIVSVGFGLGHGYQDVLGMVRAGALGYVLAVPFLLTGSLLPGIVAHAAVDLSVLTRPGRRLVGADLDTGKAGDALAGPGGETSPAPAGAPAASGSGASPSPGADRD